MAQARIKALVKGIYAEVDGEFRPLEIGEEADVPTDFADRLAPNKAERVETTHKPRPKPKPKGDEIPDIPELEDPEMMVANVKGKDQSKPVTNASEAAKPAPKKPAKQG